MKARLIVSLALTSPTTLRADALEGLADALGTDLPEAEQRPMALAAVAALLYGRPDLVDAVLVDRGVDLFAAADLPDEIGAAAVKLVEHLATTAFASRVWPRVCEILRDDRVNARSRDRLLPVVREFVEWRDPAVTLDGILALADAPGLAAHRAFLLDHGIEPFAFSAPETFTVERLQRLSVLFEQAPRYRYVLAALSGRPTLPAEARPFLIEQLAGRFPFHDTAARLLRDGPVHIFVALNAGVGQGDDVVRLVPLLQGLLDANPALRITLGTRRQFLYDNPRITPIDVGDDAAVEAALAECPEGIVEFFQPEWLDFTFRLEAHAAVERHVAQHAPGLVIRADLGRLCAGREGNRSAFLHQTVELEGQDIAGSRGLDQRLIGSIYEPSMRLLAELGLPMRTGEEAAHTPWVLTGTPSVDAESVWRELVGGDAAATRPVALFNPFGGSGPTKGFAEQDELVAAEIGGLVDEGYLVVVLPNGQPWARRGTVLGVLARLGADVTAEVRIAPDPGADESARLRLTERPTLSYADRVMRLFKYFASYANLVVTVEGWLAHLAYNVGRPFRLFGASGSFSSDWYPRGRGPAQQVVSRFSPRGHARYAASALLGPDDPPPLPHRPRKGLFELALGGLGRVGTNDVVAPLRRALSSADPDVRTWAVAALGRVQPGEAVRSALFAALQDRWPPVVREAAEALLRGGVDCTRELGPRYREVLQVETEIARQQWDAVAKVGPLALPPLFRAAQSDLYDVRAGAKALLRGALAPFVPGLAASDVALPGGPGRPGAVGSS